MAQTRTNSSQRDNQVLKPWLQVCRADAKGKIIDFTLELVEKKLLKTLGGHGLELIDPVDHPFDPSFHEAVATEPALSPEDDHMVARVYQRGYLFRGQLLRPARVVVKQWLG